MQIDPSFVIAGFITSMVALVLNVAAFLLATYALIELRAMQKSTHQIQMVPMPNPGVPHDEAGFEILTPKEKQALEADPFGNIE